MTTNFENAKEYSIWIFSQVLHFLPQLVIAIVILLAGWVLAKIIRNAVEKLLLKTKLEKAVLQFVVHLLHVFLVVVIVIMAIAELGIPTTPLTGSLVAVLIGISMSLKSSLGIVASGIMLISTRAFKVGEFVDIGGTAGTVEDINLIFCTVRTSDGREVKVPNSLVTTKVITNFSNNQYRRNDFTVGIGYNSSIDTAKSLLQELIDKDARILKIDGKLPIIRVDSLGESSVNILVRYWTIRTDFTEARWSLIENTKKTFDQNNISIPFPQRTIHLPKEAEPVIPNLERT